MGPPSFIEWRAFFYRIFPDFVLLTTDTPATYLENSLVSKRNPLSDEEIIKSIIEEGQAELFGELYDRYADKVFRKCLGFVHDRDQAQDMVQDVLLKAFTQLSKFKGNSKFSTWLYSITYNYCVEQYRRKSKVRTTDIDEGPDIKEDTDEAEQELLSFRAEKLKYALDHINPDDKVILLLKYQDNVPIKDLMTQLGLSESAVKMRLSRARQRVKEIIQDVEKRDAQRYE